MDSFKNFADVFYDNPEKSYTFGKILGWTIVWAFFATFTNYIGGMVLALLINKKGIKFKGLWRTLFVITIAVPNFVTLLVMNQLLADQGTLNLTLKDWGLISDSIPFLSDANYKNNCVQSPFPTYVKQWNHCLKLLMQ